MSAPLISIVIPVYNEEDGLQALFDRLYPALDALGETFEVIFINDGSIDRSAALLRQQFERRPEVTRIVLFNGNYGQHMAIMAGFQRARGDIVITLDADLQNPPEEIAHLVKKMQEGHDYVGTIRRKRQDSLFRRSASRMMNKLREKITHIQMTDQGCMMRAYSSDIVNVINQCAEVNTFIPALAYSFAANPTEIEVAHEERTAGESKYSLYKLIRLNFDLVTGFSVVPLQIFSLLGILTSLGSVLFLFILLIKRTISDSFIVGLGALYDRDVLGFFLIGLTLFGIGLLGEYVGRIYQQVRARPRYIIKAVLEQKIADE
ncbi:MAG: glycosyltransferase [Burkholderiaceae bacterium]|nr:MAG: glycosyltransferase [Burkholderiaceae bacterium]